jgi:hypothetical protein
MNPPSYTLTRDSIMVIWQGKSHVVQKGTPHFVGLRQALLEEKWDDVPNHLTIAKGLSSWAKGEFTLNEMTETFSYKGTELPKDINERITQMASNGEDPMPLLRFFERLQRNPSFRSVQQLYPFLKHKGIAITKDGCFFAYKGVNADYTDCHTSKISNVPGTVNKMPRNQISDDPQHACHEGFHVGARSHASGYGKRMIVCKVDPEHVVCVPYDSSQQKMRVCEYKVVGNYGDDLPDTITDEDDLAPDAPPVKAAEGNTSAYPDIPDVSEDESEQSDPADENDEAFNGDPPLPEGQIDTGDPNDRENHGGSLSRVADALGFDSNEEDGGEAKAAAEEDELLGNEVTTAGGMVIPKKYNKQAFLPLDELMKLSLDALRELATYGLKITGASKVPGGKSALAAKIIEVRGTKVKK